MAEAKKMRSEASTSHGGGSNGGGDESLVVDFGRRKSSCGYCKSPGRTSISHGLWAHSLTVDDYQTLLDRGWRRSGCYLYKPEMEKTCCPSYTIRLKASDFVPSKEQLRVSKRMQRFLDGSLDVNKSGKLMDCPHISGGSCSNIDTESTNSATKMTLTADHEGKDKKDEVLHSLSEQINNVVQECLISGDLNCDIQLPKASVKKVTSSKRKLHAEVSEYLVFTCNIAFQIAAVLQRSERVLERAKPSEYGTGGFMDSDELSPKRIAEIIARRSKQLAESSGLSVRSCNGYINFYSSKEQAHLLEEIGGSTTVTQSAKVSGSNNSCSKKGCAQPKGQKMTFEIRLKKSAFHDEEYALYRKYQLRVHNDTPDHVTESSYRRFLVDSPLIYVPPSDTGDVPPCGFGSFHQQYLVDGKLIAVGVVDILPKCLSSKYLFWDPDFAYLSLGKFSALEEIRWVRENQAKCAGLQYYYLGYYIHSCRKMRYKAAYRPSELLCPLRYEWVPYDIVKPLLDRRKYVILSDVFTLRNEESVPDVHVDLKEDQQDDLRESSKDVFINDDQEMSELDSEESDEESDGETSEMVAGELGDANINKIIIGLKGARLRYKDIRHAFESSQRKFMETQLYRYIRVVGQELSERMVYSLG